MGASESVSNLSENVEHHQYESTQRETDADQPDSEASKRKDSLQTKINIITWTTSKINRYKKENLELKEANSQLHIETGELKESLNYKKSEINELETSLKEMEYKYSKLEQDILTKQEEAKGDSNSINDILYKVPGDSVNKLKYNKRSSKYVIFINKINHLFYYDSPSSSKNNKNNPEMNPKCIVIRDINITNNLIKKRITKPWFLIIGTKRKALFITPSITIRNKWYNFICESLGKTHINRHIKSSTSTFNSFDGLFTSQNKKEICEFNYKTLSFNYPPSIEDCNIINNGHTVQININNNKCDLITDSNEIYKLKQFHFHIPCEHNICGKKYEMEMHLVHINKETNKIIVLCFIFTNKQKYINPKLELNKAKTHLILPYNSGSIGHIFNNSLIFNSSVMSLTSLQSISKLSSIQETDIDESETDLSENDIVNINAVTHINLPKFNTNLPHFEYDNNENNKFENNFLKQFWDQLPLEKNKNNIPLKNALNFEYLFKTASNNYTKNMKTNAVKINMEINEYIGELRIPPYTQGVKWYISKETHFINYKQLKKLKQIWYSYL